MPIFAANLDVGHGGTYGKPHGGEFAKVATAWLQWQLKGDNEGSKMFVGEPCGLAKQEGWRLQKRTFREQVILFHDLLASMPFQHVA